MSLSPQQLFAVLTPTQQLSATLHEAGPPGPPGPQGPPMAVQDEGTVLTAFNTLNFVGAGVTAANDAPGSRITVTIPGSSGGHTIQDEGTPLTARAGLNFVGAGVTATDDSGNNRTVVTIPGGGSQTPWTSNINAADFHLNNAFEVWAKEVIIRDGYGAASPSSRPSFSAFGHDLFIQTYGGGGSGGSIIFRTVDFTERMRIGATGTMQMWLGGALKTLSVDGSGFVKAA